MIVMDTKWLLGFIEGSGCFSIIVRSSPNNVGYQTIADFTLKLPVHQRELLEQIRSFLKAGNIYTNRKEAILKATKIDDAKKLVKFLGAQKFVSMSKQKEFAVWKRCVKLMERGSHRTPKGLLEIARLRDSVHTRKLWNKKNYCSIRLELDPCSEYLKSRHLPVGCRVCWGNSQLVRLRGNLMTGNKNANRQVLKEDA